jgi:tetratricopeptide (TPR) repeat protein
VRHANVDEGEQVTRFTSFLARFDLPIGICSVRRRSARAVGSLVPERCPRHYEPPRQDEPKYRAFLSYSPADSGVARRVGARLEGFHIDRELVGRPARGGRIPKALRPIFRNRQDFFTRFLPGDAASEALFHSAVLIILATPHSLRSNSINEEFKRFKLRHPERPVIVLIIEGTQADPNKRSFRPSLRFVVAPDWAQSPADALPLDRCVGDGFEIAIAKVVGWLIGRSWQDVHRRACTVRRRQSRISVAVAAATALLGTTGGLFFWQSHERKMAWVEAAALSDRYELASPTQAADPGAKESLSRAIAAIAEGAATDPRYAEALELLDAGKLTEAESPLNAVAVDKAKRSPKDGAAAYRNLASIAIFSHPGWAREYYAEAARLDPANIEGMFRCGWFQQQAGQLEVAEASYRRVITSTKASNNEWVLWAQFGNGDIERERGHLDDALAAYHAAGAIAENLATADPGNVGWQYDLGIGNERIGDLLMALGDPAQALKYYRTQREILSRLAEGDPSGAVPRINVVDVAAAQDDLSEALTIFQANVASMERLAKTNPASAGWQRDLAVSYERVGHLLAWQGDLPEAQKALWASLAIMDRLARIDPGNATWQHDLAMSYVRIGDVLAQQYFLSDAVKFYQASVTIADRLADADPGNARWQRELSAIYSKVGDVLAEQDGLPEALKSYRASLAIAERLTEADPGDSRWQHDLSAGYHKVGDLLAEQRDLPEALKSYQASLAVAARLAESDPHDARRQSELSEIYDTVGDVLKAQGDLPKAVKYYQAGADIAERLAKADPSNAVRRGDLAVTYRRLGDMLKAQGNLPEALRSYRAGLDIAERLTESDPGNAVRQHDLAATYSGLGDILAAVGNLPEALKSFSASLAIAERLTKINPGDAGRQRDLAIAHNEVGNIRRLQGDLAGALQSYQAGVTIMGRAAKADPGNAGWQRDLSAMYNRAGDVLKAQGKLGEAFKSYQASLAIMDRLARFRPSA